MFYRVVMQGRTVGGADIAAVKREFVRVTGLPVRVADDMFGGMPKVIKRKVPQSDAERIAATLRAIGAAATVEREAGGAGSEDETDEGINIIASPLSGPPTVAPGMHPPAEAPAASRRPAWVRDLREKWPVVAGTLAVLGAMVYFGPDIADAVITMRAVPPPAAKAVAAAAPAQAAAPAAPPNPGLLHGPWRCVDQQTGLGVYWSYGADGALTFHGDVLSDRPVAEAAGPRTWQLDGNRLVHKQGQSETQAFEVVQLSLTRLGYVGAKGLEIECRRP